MVDVDKRREAGASVPEAALLSANASATPLACAPGALCDCAPPTQQPEYLSWPRTLGLVAAGAVLSLIVVKLLGA